MNYLFIGAHTDDIELAAGGWICQLIESGHTVKCYTFSYLNKPRLLIEHGNSMEVLGVKNYTVNLHHNRMFSYDRQTILDDLIQYKESYQPDVVITHDIADVHQDHKCVAEESLRAFKFTNLLTYMAPWNGHHMVNYYVPVSLSHMDKKVEALKKYESQSHRPYMDEEIIRSTASHYTNQIPHYSYAEAFKVIYLQHQ